MAERIDKIFINGDWVSTVEGKTEAVLDPATGEVIAEVAASTAADVERAVDAATAAFPDWRATSPAGRAAALFKLADVVEANKDELVAIENQLMSMSSIQFMWSALYADATGEWLELGTITPEPDRQAAFDEQYGPGVVRLTPRLLPIN